MTSDGSVDLAGWIGSRREQVESVLEARLRARPRADDPGRLVEAMRYSLLAPGKRLRPLLALAAAEAVTGRELAAGSAPPGEHLLTAAASIEAVHCYSLIHDDLPAMDDDDFRRGKPSNHKVYGEATAILAGDALLTLAFEWLADAGEASGRAHDFGRAALALARGAGMAGMVRGQARDLGEPTPGTLSDLEVLHEEKTAALFRAAAEVGAAAAGGSRAEIEALALFGTRFGVAFQHVDDREDGDHRAHGDRVRSRVPQLLSEATAGLEVLRSPAGRQGDISGRTGILRALAAQLLNKGPAATDPHRGTDNQS